MSTGTNQRSVLGKGLSALFPGSARIPNAAGIPPLPQPEAIEAATPAESEKSQTIQGVVVESGVVPEPTQASASTPGPTPAPMPGSTPPEEWEVSPPAAKTQTPPKSPETAPVGATAAGPQVPVAQAPTIDNSSVNTSTSAARASDRIPGITLAELASIEVNPYQPRREFVQAELENLAQSIREHGVIQPLIVRKTSKGYQLIAGERRMRASKLAGLTQVPVVIRKSSDKESLEVALIENIQRQDLNCIDEALAYFQLIQDFTLTQDDIAHRVGKDRATVANSLRLLRLPEAVIEDLKKGVLTSGHGKALLGIDDPEFKIRLHKAIIEEQLSVRETERRVTEFKERVASGQTAAQAGAAQTRAESSPLESRFRSLSQDLTRTLGTKVEIKGKEKRGKIQIHYHTREELERLLETLSRPN